jgi:hypothetical protein
MSAAPTDDFRDDSAMRDLYRVLRHTGKALKA